MDNRISRDTIQCCVAVRIAIVMSLINSPSSKSSGKAGARRHENNRIYANPLPLIFEPSSSNYGSILNRIGLNLATKVLRPQCEAVFDELTKSVWVTNHEHSMLLWRRGFFGKGDLSRSEPTWLARQQNIRTIDGKRTWTSKLHYDAHVNHVSGKQS